MKTLGQLFCDDKSQRIIDLLDYLCRESNVLRLMGVLVKISIKPHVDLASA